MNAQHILDIMHAIADARYDVSIEYQKYRAENPEGKLTVVHMPSWNRSVTAERAMHKMLMNMPRHAWDLSPSPTKEEAEFEARLRSHVSESGGRQH